MDYQKYIASESWRKKRTQALDRDSHQCQTCLSQENLEVHHKTYERFGNEQLSDLITLCHDCHHAITDVIRRRRYTTREITIQDHQRTKPTISEVNYDIQELKIKDSVRSTPTLTQRTNSRSVEQIFKRNEENKQQARQDRRRL